MRFALCASRSPLRAQPKTLAARLGGGVFRLILNRTCPSTMTIEIPGLSPGSQAGQQVLSHRAQGGIQKNEVGLLPGGDNPPVQTKDPGRIPGGHADRQFRRDLAQGADQVQVRKSPRGTTPVPEGASLPKMRR